MRLIKNELSLTQTIAYYLNSFGFEILLVGCIIAIIIFYIYASSLTTFKCASSYVDYFDSTFLDLMIDLITIHTSNTYKICFKNPIGWYQNNLNEPNINNTATKLENEEVISQRKILSIYEE